MSSKQFTISGTLYEKFDMMSFKGNFTKREFVLELKDEPQYPQYIKFELQKDKCSLLDLFQKGDELEVSFDLKGKPYTNPKGEKIYFTNLVVWKIGKVGDRESNNITTDYKEEDIPEENDMPF
jgi:hypothetical protein